MFKADWSQVWMKENSVIRSRQSVSMIVVGFGRLWCGHRLWVCWMWVLDTIRVHHIQDDEISLYGCAVIYLLLCINCYSIFFWSGRDIACRELCQPFVANQLGSQELGHRKIIVLVLIATMHLNIFSDVVQYLLVIFQYKRDWVLQKSYFIYKYSFIFYSFHE